MSLVSQGCAQRYHSIADIGYKSSTGYQLCKFFDRQFSQRRRSDNNGELERRWLAVELARAPRRARLAVERQSQAALDVCALFRRARHSGIAPD